MAEKSSHWLTFLFVMLMLALFGQCQFQRVSSGRHSISHANMRFREVLQIDENNQSFQTGRSRFPQSFPNPTSSHPNLPRIPGTSGNLDDSRISPNHRLTSTQTQRSQDNTFSIHATETHSLPFNSGPISPKLDLYSNINRNQHTPERSSQPGGDQSSTDLQVFRGHSLPKFQDTSRNPEAPRVPEIPAHLPVDLRSRLQEFPSLAASIEENSVPVSTHSFFEPKIEVQSEELTDDEWQQYLVSEWRSDGVIPTLLTTPPNYLANVNYGGHECLHLGNDITPALARHKPKSFQFPGKENRLYAVFLVDMDHPRGTYLNWLLINVPFNQLEKGVEVAEYEPPLPKQGSGFHRMVFLVYLQQTPMSPNHPSLPKARACESSKRESASLGQLTHSLALKGPIAANYFRSEWDVTVEHLCSAK